MATILEKSNQILEDKNTNLLPEYLKNGITCLGVNGNLIELIGQEKVIAPSTSEQIITPDEGYNGITSVIISAVTSDIDANIKPENIRKDTNILGVTGTLDDTGYNSQLDMSTYMGEPDYNSCRIWQYITEIKNVDASGITDMSFMFTDCTNLVTVSKLNICNATSLSRTFLRCTSLKNISELNTESVTSLGYAFSGCTSLTEMPLLDTHNVTHMGSMLKGCTNLVTMPQFDTSQVTAMGSAFSECTSLSKESLNNILAMCINAINYTATKTLVAIGLTEEQANTCTTLPNYEAFASAGWTTGY